MKTILFSTLFVLSIGQINAQVVTIPDANFKAYLVGNNAINTNSDTEIQVSEAQAYVGSIDCDNLSITDLTGIEAFSAITFLGCSNNLLTSLDLSQNSSLEEVFCFNNQLTSLILGSNTNLGSIYCYDNQLTNLDLSQNPGLTVISCGNNDLNALDLTQNPNLISVDCNSNQITSLDVSNNTSMTILLCGANQLSALNLSNNADLVWLSCVINSITSLDVSANSALTQLHCNVNALTSLDVSNNTNLALLNCGVNQLTSLDLSNNPNLTNVLCGFNQLTSLNIANGNNTIIGELRTAGNDSLTCIQVDDAAYSTTNWTGGSFLISPLISFSENCGGTADVTDIEPSQLSIYPNPANAAVTFQFEGATADVTIYTTSGTTILQKTIMNQESINLQTIESGVYFVQVSINGSNQIKQLIIQ